MPKLTRVFPLLTFNICQDLWIYVKREDSDQPAYESG